MRDIVEEHHWGVTVTVYLFLAGLGAGLFLVVAGADVLGGLGDSVRWGAFLSPLLVAAGAALLLLELSKPLAFWRVFTSRSAPMAIGARLLALFTLAGLAYASCWVAACPWSTSLWLRQGLAWAGMVLALAVAIYTGVLLGGQEARPLWNCPGMPVTFVLSALSSGTAAAWMTVAATRGESDPLARILVAVSVPMLTLYLVAVLSHVLMAYSSKGSARARGAELLVRGRLAGLFWGGVVGLGGVGPLVVALFAAEGALAWLAAVCVLAGALLLRHSYLSAGVRQGLPGEARFLSTLPGPDAPIWRSDL